MVRHRDNSAAVVTTLVIPDSSARDGAIHTSVHANAKAIEIIVDTPLVYIGQAHSHPGSHVSHSYVDDRETFATFDGVVSIVVPWFGRYGLSIHQCGLYRYLGGRFCRIEDVSSHFRILPGFADLRTEKPEALVHDE